MIRLGLLILVALLRQNAPGQAPPGTPPVTVEGIVVSFGTTEPIGRAVVELRPKQGGSAFFTLPAELEALYQSRLQASAAGGTPPNVPLILASEIQAALNGSMRPIGIPMPGSAPLTATTAADGKFAIHNVTPGEYELYATRSTGFIPGEYGQRTPTGTGTSLKLSGQNVTGIRLSMAPTASITGRITDREGDPVPYSRVDLLRKAYQGGKPIFEIAQAVTSDDRGEYRLYSLPPGQYYVTARPFEGRSRVWSSDSEPTIVPNRFAAQQVASAPLVTRRVTEFGDFVEETWMPVFYPGTTDSRSAQAIALHMGENIRGLDINLASSGAPARHVRGVVMDSVTGREVGGATIRLIPRAQLTPTIVLPGGSTDGIGRFDIQGVLPAAYSLLVSGPVNGYLVLDVGASNIDGLQIVGTQGIDIPWRGTFDGRDDESAVISRLRITLTRDPVIAGAAAGGGGFASTTMGWASLPAAAVTPTSQQLATSTVLKNVPPGEYRVSVNGLPQGAYVKSATVGRTDVLAEGLRVAATPDSPLEIVLASDTGALSGRVINENQQTAANVTVVLVPNSSLRFRTDLFKNVSTDEAGTFHLDGIAPGDYKVFAWEQVVSGAWHDPDFMRPQEALGAVVRVGQGGSGTLDVKLILWKDAR